MRATPSHLTTSVSARSASFDQCGGAPASSATIERLIAERNDARERITEMVRRLSATTEPRS